VFKNISGHSNLLVLLIGPGLEKTSLLMQFNTVSDGKNSWSVLKKYIERQPCYPVKPPSAGDLEHADDAMHNDIIL